MEYPKELCHTQLGGLRLPYGSNNQQEELMGMWNWLLDPVI